MFNKYLKLSIFILLIISLLLIIFYGLFGSSISYLSLKEIKKDRELKEDLIETIEINGIEAVYESTDKLFYYMVPEQYENKNYIFKLKLDSGYKYKILDCNLNIIEVDYNKPLDIIIYNDKYYYEAKIQLTNLPIISIMTDTEEKIGEEEVKSEFKYINPGNVEKIISSNMTIKIRGASSRNLSKKSYKLEFYNSDYTKEKDINIPNFYDGDTFILDAIYRDKSKIRNILSTEIWNSISDDYNNVDINSEFVEVFINNEYYGLYVFTEPVKRKTLNLKKSNDSSTSYVIKSIGWNSIYSDTNSKNISSNIYKSYEIKYPNDESLYPEVWEKFINKISEYYDEGVKSDEAVIRSTFNMNNYIDLIIFNSFTNNVDNCLRYNNYFYMNDINDNQIYIQPWDMEFSYGYYVDETKLALLEYNKIVCEFKHKDLNINKLLVERYWNLRKNILTEEYFDNLLDEYKNNLSKGSSLRDSQKWYKYNLEKEIEDVRVWIHKRIEYFDQYVGEIDNG